MSLTIVGAGDVLVILVLLTMAMANVFLNKSVSNRINLNVQRIHNGSNKGALLMKPFAVTMVFAEIMIPTPLHTLQQVIGRPLILGRLQVGHPILQQVTGRQPIPGLIHQHHGPIHLVKLHHLELGTQVWAVLAILTVWAVWVVLTAWAVLWVVMANQLLHLHQSLPQDIQDMIQKQEPLLPPIQEPLMHLCHQLNHNVHGIRTMVACVHGAMLVTRKTNASQKMFVTVICVPRTSPSSSVTQTLMELPVTGRKTHAKVRDKNQSDILILAKSIYC